MEEKRLGTEGSKQPKIIVVNFGDLMIYIALAMSIISFIAAIMSRR